MRPTTVLATATAMITGVFAVVLPAQRPDAFPARYDHPSIQYLTRPVRDRVSRLNQDLQDGKVQLAFDRASGYLLALLAALEVPKESQVLVFSETSSQAPLINPRNPRALFFNDATAVGWVRSSEALEVAVQDPAQGTIFYTLEQKPAERPQLKREVTCLQCHLTWDTLAVPGPLMVSTFQMSDDPNAYAAGVVADHRTPIEQRWGGWYVTGKTVPSRHMGNVPVVVPAAQLTKPGTPPPQLQSVEGRFDASEYPSGYSDVAALMVLGHQTHMTNLLTRLGWEARLAEYQRTRGGAGPAGRGGEADRVREAAHDLVDYLLFVEEAPIVGKIEGLSGFAERFAAQGPLDGRGRSLRQLDLERRMMRYPCSYMIYSEAFDTLPPDAKDEAYRRMWQVLSGQDTGKLYARLSLADRQAIVDILRDTKKDLPDYFRAVTR